MARWWDQNRAVLADHGSAFLYAFKEEAKVGGWTVLQASDGANYVNDGSDPITSVAEMTADNTWILLQMPDGVRKFMIAHSGSTDHNTWYIGYSKSGTYNNGDATHPATTNTASENPIWGQYTAPSTRTPISYATGSNSYLQIMINDAAPYDFYAILAVQGTGVVQTMLYGEEVLDPTVGDLDPFVCSAKKGNSVALFGGMSLCPVIPPTVFGHEYGANGWAGDTWSSFGYLGWSECSSLTQFPPYSGGHGPGVNPWDSTDDSVRPVIARINNNGNASYKGISNLVRYPGVIRSAGDLLTIDAAGDWIAYGNILLPWNNTVASI